MNRTRTAKGRPAGLPGGERARRGLQERIDRLEAILDAIPEAVVTVDGHGIIQMANRAADRMFGYAASELIGTHASELVISPPAGEPGSKRRRDPIVAGGYEAKARRRDGSIFPIELSVSQIDTEGDRLFTGIVRDISERKLAEEALRRERDFAERLIDTAHAIVLLLDREGRIVRFNRYMAELSGYGLDELRGKDWFSTFIPEVDREEIQGVFAAALDGRRTRGNINAILTRNGSRRLIEWYDAPLTDGEGNVVGILALGNDITERRRAEEQLRESEKRARAAEELASLSMLAAGIAHDIGTPMNVILGYAEMIQKSLPDDENRRRARTISEQVRRVTDLVQNLLNLAHPRGPVCVRIDLADSLDEALSFCSQTLRDSHVTVDRCYDPAPPISGDPDGLQQVFLNLLVNAADAMPDGGMLRVSLAVPDAAHVEVRVADTGTGIAPANLRRIFEPFYTTKPHGKGTGLGLLVTKRIVVEHGGTIDVTSQAGRGTEFRLVFPTGGAEQVPGGASSGPAGGEA